MPKKKPQIFMWSRERDHLLARHDFYMEQVKARVLRSFDNMEEEAEQIDDELYERLAAFDSEGGDMTARAEIARHDGMEFFLLLCHMKTQTTLGALASLYHQWEKDFRGFMQRQQILVRNNGNEEKDYFWHCETRELFDALESFGWSIRESKIYQSLESCRLIVNVYKHGKGPSLESLIEYFPQYLKGRLSGSAESSLLGSSRHEDLAVTEEQFDQIGEGIRQFWRDFPSRLVLVTDPDTDRT
ncbi:MAG: hypothetical protein OXI64_10635 [Defluviicoccus sp.]|nr:hypothetical protein [Defluviicoccus sp.]